MRAQVGPKAVSTVTDLWSALQDSCQILYSFTIGGLVYTSKEIFCICLCLLFPKLLCLCCHSYHNTWSYSEFIVQQNECSTEVGERLHCCGLSSPMVCLWPETSAGLQVHMADTLRLVSTWC